MKSRIIPLLLAFFALVWIGAFSLEKWNESRKPAQGSADMVADQASRGPRGKDLPILWDSPSFSYPDQAGRTVTDQELRGHVWIADFFFTSCTSICPMMTAKMSQMYKEISPDGIVFISFSVDPDHDTQKVLAEYAKMWGADESRWHFLSTTREGLAATTAGMKTFVRPADESAPIQHSSIFILVDADGKVRGVYDSLDSNALKRLNFDAQSLAGKNPPPLAESDLSWQMPNPGESSNNAGAVLYAARGCAACHSQERVAPPLDHCFGDSVMLEDGRMVTIDDAYLRESILDPGAKIVAGYSHMMPSYRNQLTTDEVDQLVQYVKSLGGPTPTTNVAATTQPTELLRAIDPVCGMSIAKADTQLHEVFNGKTYYFCSTTCREAFLKNPAKYAASGENSAKSAVPTP